MNKAVLLVIAVVAAAGIALLMLPSHAGTQATGVLATPAPAAGHPAPDFTLSTADGSHLHLDSLHGKVVLVNFWATWCQPCRQEMPRLAAWYRAHHSQGFVVLGVDKEEPPSDVRSFLHRLDIPYPVVVDGSGVVVADYHILALPQSILIDHRGIIRQVTYGVVNERYLDSHVIPLLRSLKQARSSAR